MKILTWCSGSTHQQRHRCKWNILLASTSCNAHLAGACFGAQGSAGYLQASPEDRIPEEGRPWQTMLEYIRARYKHSAATTFCFIPRNTRGDCYLSELYHANPLWREWMEWLCDNFRWNALCQRRWVSLLTHPVKASQSALLGVSGPY